ATVPAAVYIKGNDARSYENTPLCHAVYRSAGLCRGVRHGEPGSVAASGGAGKHGRAIRAGDSLRVRLPLSGPQGGGVRVVQPRGRTWQRPRREAPRCPEGGIERRRHGALASPAQITASRLRPLIRRARERSHSLVASRSSTLPAQCRICSLRCPLTDSVTPRRVPPSSTR